MCFFLSFNFYISLCCCFLVVSAEDADKRKRMDPKDNPLTQWFTIFSEADELLKLAAARQQVTINLFNSVLTYELLYVLDLRMINT